jgi:hypothetical protein
MELEVTIKPTISNGWFEINYRGNVGFVEGRNSIIQADAALYDGVMNVLIVQYLHEEVLEPLLNREHLRVEVIKCQMTQLTIRVLVTTYPF